MNDILFGNALSNDGFLWLIVLSLAVAIAAGDAISNNGYNGLNATSDDGYCGW